MVGMGVAKVPPPHFASLVAWLLRLYYARTRGVGLVAVRARAARGYLMSLPKMALMVALMSSSGASPFESELARRSSRANAFA